MHFKLMTVTNSAQSVEWSSPRADGRELGDPVGAYARDRAGHADVEGRTAAPGRALPQRAAWRAGRVRLPGSGRPVPQPGRGLPGPEPGLGGFRVHAGHDRAA